MSKPGKQPQDRKPKVSAVDRLAAEARKSLPDLSEMQGLKLTVAGRHGEVTVEILDDPLEWDAEVFSLLQQSDYLGAVCGAISTQDGQALRAVRPSVRSLLEALMQPIEETGEASVGESQAS